MVKLLIADDESRTRAGLTSLISKSRLPIQITGAAANGIQALSLAKSLPPDILLTDVRMPRLDGIGLSTQVRKFAPGCQIIFISGYADKEYLKSAIFLKAVGYVEKPIEEQEILSALTNAIHNIEESRQQADILRQNLLLQQQHQDILRAKAALELTLPSSDTSQSSRLAALYPAFWGRPHYCTLLCHLNSDPESQKGGADSILPALDHMLTAYDTPYLLALKKPGIFIIHLCDIEPDRPDAFHARIDRLYEKMRTALPDFFLAAGSPVPTPAQLYESYINAVICSKRLFFTGYNHVHYFNGAENAIGKAFSPKDTLYPEFARTLQDGNRPATVSIVTMLFQEMRQPAGCFEINSIKNVYYQLLLTLDSICQKRGLSDIFPHDRDFIWESVSQSNTIFSLQSYLTDRLSLYFDTLADREGSSLLVYHIRQYIEAHFGEPALSVNQLAAALHFTSAYLCRTFKTETGITIHTYLNEFRIEKAKDLLLTTDTPLYEVSSLVGYSDPNYFTRQFKKQTGITPSEYRERHAL